jgi:hypothetical protein
VALGELLAVRAVQERQVREGGRLGAERLVDEQLLGRVGEVVLPADDVGDLRVEVVDRDGEVVERGAVGAGDDRVVQVGAAERRVAPDDVVDDELGVVGHAQAHRALGLLRAAEAAVGPLAAFHALTSSPVAVER